MIYQRIKNFPENAAAYGSAELKALGAIWLERQDALRQTGVFQEFLKKLQREWAVETGIIERLYTWDRGVTEILIEHGIEATIIAHRGGMQKDEADHATKMITDHLDIVDGLFSFVKREQPLTEYFIRSLHQQFTKHQDHTEALTQDRNIVKIPLEKGKYKTNPNNPKRSDGEMHEYCPPELVTDEMQQLITWYQEHDENMPTEVKSAWLHHRFTQIHPFQDGNGRVARALASLVFIKENYFPIVIRDTDRKEYISALESADAGNLQPLAALFARRQKQAVLQALGLEQQVQQNRHVDQIISSALQVLQRKYAAAQSNVGCVYSYADELTKIAEERMRQIAELLDAELGKVTPPQQNRYSARSTSACNASQNRHYFYDQIVEVARKFNYFANLDRYRSWIRISIRTEEQFEFLASIHGYGYGETGIMAAAALTYRRVKKEDGGNETISVQPAAIDLFQFNYAEPLDSIKERFLDWLETALAIGLNEWRRIMAA